MRIWVGLTLSLVACSLVDLDDLERGTGSRASAAQSTVSASGVTASSSPATAASTGGTTASGTGSSSGTGGAPGEYYLAVLGADPMAYYRFDDDPDSLKIADETGNYAITYTGAENRRVAGGFAESQWAMHLDGQSRGQLPAGFEFEGTAPFSIELWFRVASTSGLQFVFANDTGVVPDRRGYVIVTYSDASIGIERWGFDPQNVQIAPGARTGAGTVIPGKWHHFVATWDGNVHAVYLDGVVGTSHGIVVTLPADPEPAYLGADGDGNAHFDGDIDELAIYPTALSKATILKHFELAGNN